MIRLALLLAACAAGSACGRDLPAAPPSPPVPTTLNRAEVIDALDYWRDAVGISYLIVTLGGPNLLVRPGTDGLGTQGGGRGGISATDDDDNEIRGGLVVIEPGGGQYCRGNAVQCRYLYRHEIGHALGFSGHSGLAGALMQSGSDRLHERERAMMAGLYSLPFAAIVSRDGSWVVAATGATGQLDVQVANDIVDWNMLPSGSASFRSREVIARWALPVPVYLQDR
jgi:hypothetical protein